MPATTGCLTFMSYLHHTTSRMHFSAEMMEMHVYSNNDKVIVD